MKDHRGVDISTNSSQNLEIYERALRAFNTYRGDPVAIIDNALETDADFAMEAATAGEGTNAMMTRQVGLPIARAVEAFGRECYSEAADHLMPVRYRAYVFGGSHAQRDIVHRTLIEAALRGGNRPLATALVNERRSLKPHCPFSWQLYERATAA